MKPIIGGEVGNTGPRRRALRDCHIVSVVKRYTGADTDILKGGGARCINICENF